MKRWGPAVVALIAASVAFAVGMALVHDDLAERQAAGFYGFGQYRFVVMLTLLAGFVAFFLALRLMNGPSLTREDWAVYRAKGPAPLDRLALLERLRLRGYTPSEARDGTVSPTAMLIRQAGHKHGGVTVDIAQFETFGCGLVIADDTGNELYTEMAQFTMLELGRILPGITYRGSTSSLTPESTEQLDALLPDRPHALK